MGTESGSWRDVSLYRDGDDVDASSLNAPIIDLASRTEYLKNEISGLVGAEPMSSVRFSAALSETDTPEIGDVVRFDPSTRTFAKALASMSAFDAHVGSDGCFAIGILTHIESQHVGTVVSSGVAAFPDGYDVNNSLEDGEEFRDGMYFLSSTQPGKVTSVPTGPRVQVGVFTVSGLESSGKCTAYICPQYGDALSHIHRSYRLSAMPCGTVSIGENVSSGYGFASVRGYAPDVVRDGSSTAAAPYLRIRGGWTSGHSEAYTITLSNVQAFPCTLSWRSTSGSSGSGTVDGFFSPVEVENGFSVELEPYSMNDLSTVYAGSDSEIVWTLKLPDCGLGWSDNSVCVKAEPGDTPVIAYGRASSRANGVNVFVPEKLYELPEAEVGSSIEITGGSGSLTISFVSVDDDTAGSEGVMKAVVGGSSVDTYSKIVSGTATRSMLNEKGIFIVVDESSGKVYCGASSVVSGSLVGSNTVLAGRVSGTTGAMVCDDMGSSLTPGYPWAVFATQLSGAELSNGMHMALVDEAPVWSKAELDVSTGCDGAAYRYGIEFDPDMLKAFPPVPARSGSLVFNGVFLEPDVFFGDRATFSVGGDSVYWCNGLEPWTPWPMCVKSGTDIVSVNDENRIMFHFVSGDGMQSGSVTSIRPAEGSPVKITRCGTSSSASTGDLQIDVDMSVDVGDGDTPGYKAVKTSRNGRLVLGPLVERIVAGPGISVVSGIGEPDGQGSVVISASNASYSGDMDTIALENAKEEMVGMFPYIRLLGWSSSGKNVDTGFVAKFHVPVGIEDAVYRVRVYTTVFGESSFDGSTGRRNAGVSMTYSVLPEVTPLYGKHARASFNVKSDRIEPDEARIADIPFGYRDDESSGYRYAAFDPILVHNDSDMGDSEGRCAMAFGSAFPDESECSSYLASHVVSTSSIGVRPGSVVAIRFRRCAPSTGTPYEGRLGFMNLRWGLVKASEAVESENAKNNGDVSGILEKLRRYARGVNMERIRVIDEIRMVLTDLVDRLR